MGAKHPDGNRPMSSHALVISIVGEHVPDCEQKFRNRQLVRPHTSQIIGSLMHAKVAAAAVLTAGFDRKESWPDVPKHCEWPELSRTMLHSRAIRFSS
jgi:hypothetical protein